MSITRMASRQTTVVKTSSSCEQKITTDSTCQPKKLARGDVVTLNVSAYCGCQICTGKWSEFGLTASGKPPVAGRTVAADWSVLPFGTKLRVPGFGMLRVEDTGSAIKGYKLDIYMESHEEAKQFGRRNLVVKIA